MTTWKTVFRIKLMLTLLKDLGAYLRHPYIVRIPEKIDQPLKLILRLVFICLILGFGTGILSSMLVSYKLIPDPGPSMMDEGRIPRVIFALGAVIGAPLMEECVFRWQLRRLSANILFVAFVAGIGLSIILKTNWAYLISPVVFIILYLIYRFNVCSSLTLKFNFWARIFPLHFHFTAICFALVHLSNFEKGASLLPLGILYTLPQLSIGFVLGYTRMNYGLKYSMAVHSLYNLTFILLLFSKQ